MNNKLAIKLNPLTEVEMTDKLRESIKSEPSEKARQINKNALELLRQMRI